MGARKYHPLWWVWTSMVRRCHNPNARDFSRYGGRGVRVCDEWRHAFARFVADIPQRPTAEHQLDRIDNNRGYEPGNVRWATRSEQMRNRRPTTEVFHGTVFLTVGGVTKDLKTWTEQLGISHHTAYYRVRRGWSHAEALELEPRRVLPRGRHAVRLRLQKQLEAAE